MMVRGICIRLRAPSCIRAPPEAVTTTSAACCRTASRAAATIASPTAVPIEPPMKSKAKAATTARRAPIVPCATMIASSSPVSARAALSLSA
jgi:hypothetical protein